jgi:glycosyltransferase involved in cell wall biosynthesis
MEEMTGFRWAHVAPPVTSVAPMSKVPTLAVIVAVHDMAARLGAALGSAFDQTLPADEVVVCDDGSTDEVDEALEPHRRQITLVRIPHRGEGAAKNAAVAACTTDFVVVLDADDEMDRRRLEAISWLARSRPDLDLIVTELEQVGPGAETHSWRLAEQFPAEDQRRAILRSNFLPAPALRRRALLEAGGFDEELTYGTDWECHIRMVLRGSRAGLILAPLYRYHRWPGQQTADRQRVLDGRVDVLERVAARLPLGDEDRVWLDRSLAAARLNRWRWALHHGRPEPHDALTLARSRSLGPKSRLLAAIGSVVPTAARAADRRNRP